MTPKLQLESRMTNYWLILFNSDCGTMTTALKKSALSSLCVVALLLTFVASTRLSVGQETNDLSPLDQNPAQSQDGTETQSSQDADGQLGQSGDPTLPMAVRQLSDFIPSDGDLDPDVVSKLRVVAETYSDRDLVKVRELLAELKTSSPMFPPVEMMEAVLHFSANQNNAGFQMLETAAIKAPGYPGIYFAFGRMALNQNRLTDAGALAEKAAKIFQSGQFSAVETDHFRGQYFQIVTLIALKQGRFKEATELGAKFERLMPNDVRSLALSAEVLCANGEPEKSFEYLQRLQKIKPDVKNLELIIAGWCRNLGRQRESDDWMRRAGRQYPDKPSVQIAVADWAVTLEDFEMAAKAVENAEKANGKESPATLWIKGQIAFAKGDYPAAEGELEQLYESNKTSSEISHQYALCLIESSDEEKKYLAQELATQNLQASPTNPRALSALAWIMLRRGEKQNAQQLFARATKNGNMAADTAYYLARFVSENGDDPGALNLLEQAVQRKGYFMYRKPANELLKTIKAKLAEESGEDLPKPTQ